MAASIARDPAADAPTLLSANGRGQSIRLSGWSIISNSPPVKQGHLIFYQPPSPAHLKSALIKLIIDVMANSHHN
jgi:hypothetical protein